MQFLGVYSKEMEAYIHQRLVQKCSQQLYLQKPKPGDNPDVFTRMGEHKPWWICIVEYLLLSNKKEAAIETCINKDECKNNYFEWKKPGPRVYIMVPLIEKAREYRLTYSNKKWILWGGELITKVMEMLFTLTVVWVYVKIHPLYILNMCILLYTITVGPWTTWIWANQVNLYVDFFSTNILENVLEV